MGTIFGKVSLSYRLKCYVRDLFRQIVSLPSYINPPKLKARPLSVEEKEFLKTLPDE